MEMITGCSNISIGCGRLSTSEYNSCTNSEASDEGGSFVTSFSSESELTNGEQQEVEIIVDEEYRTESYQIQIVLNGYPT